MSEKQPAIVVWKTEAQIRARVEELSRKIQRDFDGEEICVTGILRGAFIFMADLVRAMDLNMRCQFMNLYYKESSYKDNQIKEVEETSIYPAFDLAGKNVLLVCPLLDTGVIMDHIVNQIKLQGVKTARIAALVDKTFLRRVDLKAEYVAFESFEQDYVFGYGLDYQEKYRNLPYLAKFR